MCCSDHGKSSSRQVSDSLRHQTRARRHGLTVSGMGINGLEKTEGNPDVDGDYMQVWLEPAVEKWPDNRSCSEDHNFERMCVFCCKTERCGIFVMELVNMLVEQGSVEELVSCGYRASIRFRGVGAGARGSTNRNNGTCPRR